MNVKQKIYKTKFGPLIKYRNNLGHETFHPISSSPIIPTGGWIEIEQEDESWRKYEYSDSDSQTKLQLMSRRGEIQFVEENVMLVDPVRYCYNLLCSFNLPVDEESFKGRFDTKSTIKIDRRWKCWRGATVLEHIMRKIKLVVWLSNGKIYLVEPGQTPLTLK